MTILCRIFGHKWTNPRHSEMGIYDEVRYVADSKDCVRCKTRWWMHERKNGSVFWVEDGTAD